MYNITADLTFEKFDQQEERRLTQEELLEEAKETAIGVCLVCMVCVVCECMSACVCACMHSDCVCVYIVCVYVCVAAARGKETAFGVYMYIVYIICVCMYVCMYVCLCVCMHSVYA